MLADGETVLIDRMSDPELFDATLGGMGLTGIILDVDVEMVAVPGNKIKVETSRTQDLQETLAALIEAEATHRYSVGWIDLVARGAKMGRGVVTSGNHTSVRDESPLKEPHISIPGWWNLNLVNHSSVRAFNEVWYHKASRVTKYATQSYDTFFYPLDMLGYWNRLYGKRGFLQYQFVIPLDSDETLTPIVERICSMGVPVSLAVLKRLGPESTGYLSFPMPGWTLAMDIPIPSTPVELESLLRELDLLVVEAGGRIYLSKDSRLGSDLVGRMYPDFGRFRAVRERVDPDRVFQSDLAERLGL